MKKFWEPWKWFELAMSKVLGILLGLWQALLSLVGIHPKAPRGTHQDIKSVDVADAYLDEAEHQAGTDAALSGLQEAPDVVLAYARASVTERVSMDLGKLSATEQDWLLRLTDRDLILLSASGRAACARSLQYMIVIPSLPRAKREKLPEELPTVLHVPTDEDHVRERFMMSVRSGGHALALKPH
ncbi:hypothetical protein QO002_002921 [Pararhizobium capsulatum DSM 1112]|uniref:Uncharacterized protein n=1 Tax=Pararhizobium capsulatum DSM 1112 TaxID=1121113 RepID=A0ABU0BS49_9HYPH|nr:hypothetical protein [Pararhizobium capsulatum]MDQ0320783.1 hypothetical protein [Pararhizobium capsulatum DSM 1112]